MIVWGRSERRWHAAEPLLLIAIGFGGAGLSGDLITMRFLLTCVLVGAYSFKAPFWALSMEFLSPGSAAVGLAAINAIGSLVGGLMVNVYGVIFERAGSTNLAMSPTALTGIVSALLILIVARRRTRFDNPVLPNVSRSAKGLYPVDSH
ncbi:hypothetical protein [Bradyrhizobium sp. AZCC 2289]|uniref:hypothetical protein n=1 Tax=Bradyrhizobium sp. AZCC 2289 TaxID=3117026 RepID=UPI002FF21B37